MRYHHAMRARTFACWIATIGAAHASPLQPKAAPVNLPLEAAKAFADAVIADRSGDELNAADAYEHADQLSPQPEIAYNLVELYLRLEQLDLAAKALARYVGRAPKAPDRADLEHRIAALREAPASITFGGRARGVDEPYGLIVVDGKLVGLSPVTVQLEPGVHSVARFTATTRVSLPVEVKPHESRYFDLPGHVEPGNVYLDADVNPWRDGDVAWAPGRRIAIAPGRYKTTLGDGACTPIELDIRSERELSFVRVDLAERERGATCRRVIRFRIEHLQPRQP
jgi:tetratricopeptide (TPR) repeat protein